MLHTVIQGSMQDRGYSPGTSPSAEARELVELCMAFQPQPGISCATTAHISLARISPRILDDYQEGGEWRLLCAHEGKELQIWRDTLEPASPISENYSK